MSDDEKVRYWPGDGTFIDLPNDVYEELMDGEYRTRQHYSRATYALGCRRPLCRLAETHRGRKRNEQRVLDDGREYHPRHKQDERELILAPIVMWHLNLRGSKAIEQPIHG